MKSWIRKVSLMAGVLAVGVSAQAAVYYHQGKISVVRSKDSQLNVRFSGASVALVELRINGLSVGTKKLSQIQSSGEAAFDFELDSLHDGDNQVEVRLFDSEGKMVGSESSVISTQVEAGPVFLSSPKGGATTQGAVEISVGFGREFKSVFVSFFVDNQFRAMSNAAPYSYIWDTTGDANGWHEVEAWVVEEGSTTFKTRKTKIFVNNPGGRTERVLPKTIPVNNTTKVATGLEAGIKAAGTTSGAAAAGIAANMAPSIAVGRTVNNQVNSGAVGTTAGLKVAKSTQAASLAAGMKLTVPSLSVLATAKPPVKKPIKTLPKVVVETATTKTATGTKLAVTQGTRLPNLATYTILLSGKPVTFDVAPRVVDGIPLTPFRHLFEQAGGEVKWDNLDKSVHASGMGKEVSFKIGETSAWVNKLNVKLEIAPFLERGRSVVPLSFISDTLNVKVDYDPTTGHVLITKK